MMLVRSFLTYPVLAHVGHDHSRDQTVGETRKPADERSAIETVPPEEAGEDSQTEPTSSVPVVSSEITEPTTDGFAVGFGEAAFVVLLLLPFFLMVVKRRIHSKQI